jgi:hypothetical protein
MFPASGKLSRGFEHDRASLYGILPMKQYQGLSSEQLEDLADAAPADDEDSSKKRMIRVATKNDLSILRKPHTIGRKVRETDFIHMENLGDLQDMPNLEGPTSFNYGDVLQQAIQTAQKRRARFSVKASGQQRRDIDFVEAGRMQ